MLSYLSTPFLETGMKLWTHWLKAALTLRSVCSRMRTFLWFITCIAGMTVRVDLLGVTSILRALGLSHACYDRILDFFHGTGLKLDKLARVWTQTVLTIFPSLPRVNGRLLLVGDGIKIPKEGRKMPAVKGLHQDSESNSKPSFIMGHSFQTVGILVRALTSVFAVPLISRIHEGLVVSNRDTKTLLDKMIVLIDSLGLDQPFYFIADAYYASGKIVKKLLIKHNHLISRVKNNAVAYFPSTKQVTGRGRKKVYGEKIRLRDLLLNPDSMHTAPSPIYGEINIQLRYLAVDLIWRPVGILVRFVAVLHPVRGKCILMSTDLSLSALDIIGLYGLRFKIELSFKQAVRTIGAYAYHFWMKHMKPIKRFSGNQYLHKQPEAYRLAVQRKMDAYHRFVQTGLIAQGLLQYLAVSFPQLVFASFGSWFRTLRTDVAPSERVTAIALRQSLPEFLSDSSEDSIFKKFILNRIDLNRSEGLRLVA
jgi:hypothetical protein